MALLNKASDGDVSAIKEVFDRLDGKVVNQINAEVNDNRPIYVVTGIEDEEEDNSLIIDTRSNKSFFLYPLASHSLS